ncbi:MAG: hypothetical protein WCI04_06045 [archaeon]
MMNLVDKVSCKACGRQERYVEYSIKKEFYFTITDTWICNTPYRTVDNHKLNKKFASK